MSTDTPLETTEPEKEPEEYGKPPRTVKVNLKNLTLAQLVKFARAYDDGEIDKTPDVEKFIAAVRVQIERRVKLQAAVAGRRNKKPGRGPRNTRPKRR